MADRAIFLDRDNTIIENDGYLGDASKVPQTWPDDRYDLVWVLETDEQGRVGLREVPQMLLAGDKPTPIGTGPSPDPG